ncbi:unnamed protein product [Adineta steineri]|uniref:Uncharacterized protein n=1 Tax=Adineta steineri TaxID=433720 RepID=A0A814ZM01_9BILA|nr:unnamed protein product [Adineta steineri]
MDRWLRTDELRKIPLLTYLNKIDLSNELKQEYIIKKMKLNDIKNQNWHLQPCSAYTGDGLYVGLDWLVRAMKPPLSSQSTLVNVESTTTNNMNQAENQSLQWLSEVDNDTTEEFAKKTVEHDLSRSHEIFGMPRTGRFRAGLFDLDNSDNTDKFTKVKLHYQFYFYYFVPYILIDDLQAIDSNAIGLFGIDKQNEKVGQSERGDRIYLHEIDNIPVEHGRFILNYLTITTLSLILKSSLSTNVAYRIEIKKRKYFDVL